MPEKLTLDELKVTSFVPNPKINAGADTVITQGTDTSPCPTRPKTECNPPGQQC